MTKNLNIRPSDTKSVLIFLFACLTLNGFSTSWHTIANGYWNQTNIWQNGIIPPVSSSDSIYFHHDVALTDDITLTNGGFMKVDSLAGICGHVTLTIGVNSSMIKYGYCQIDTLLVPGGDVDFYPPGYSIFAMWGQISNGGSFSLNGSGLTVGAWFQCQKGPATIPEEENATLNIYPNPFQDVLFFESENETISEISIYDATGKLILCTRENKISTTSISPGIYTIEIHGETTLSRKKIIKSR